MRIVLKFLRSKKLKNKIMKKTLELDEQTALRIYPTAAPELKEILEKSFGGKEFFSQKITDKAKDYPSVCNILGVDPSDRAIKIEVEGFNVDELMVVRNFIKKMRVCKVLNEGWLPKRGDRRWYSWYDVSSGFVFGNTSCADTTANTTSASRLCLKNEPLAMFFSTNFKDIDEGIIDL
jgi:hypothetical protein